MVSNYTFHSYEVGEYYQRVATRKPTEANRGGGVRATLNDMTTMEAEKVVDVLSYFAEAFADKKDIKAWLICNRAIDIIQNRIFVQRRVIYIADASRGERISRGEWEVPVAFRKIICAMRSYLLGKVVMSGRQSISYFKVEGILG